MRSWSASVRPPAPACARGRRAQATVASEGARESAETQGCAGIFFSIFTTFLVWADYHFAGTRSSSEQVCASFGRACGALVTAEPRAR
jgi:hypothetical protein